MNDLNCYPVYCRKNIRKLMQMLCTDAQTAYGMMKMTAALMDLNTNDDKVIESILMDCDLEMEVRA